MTRPRLDQILLRHGVISEEQIRQALMRQRSHGGRLGTHLFYYRFLSEEQLVNALGEQFGVPGIVLSDVQIPEEVLEKVSVKLVEEFCLIPFAFDPQTRSLSLAMLVPDNREALAHIKKESGVQEVKQFVAVESVLRDKIASFYHGKSRNQSDGRIIEMPELFSEEENFIPQGEEVQSIEPDTPPQKQNVLMITRAAFLRNFLVSVFEREGYALQLLSEPEETAQAMGECTFDHILVSQDMSESFTQWGKEGIIPVHQADVSVFSTVCGALLDNPAPYQMLIESLIMALQKMSECRCAQSTWKPSYDVMCSDIRNLAHELGLRRIAVDGLQIISSLLIPADNKGKDNPAGSSKHPLQFEESKEFLARAAGVHFPWDIEGCIHSFFELLSGKLALTGSDDQDPEKMLGIQILAAVWYRYCSGDGIEGNRATILEAIKALLREQEGHLFSSEVLETYIRVMEQTRKQVGSGAQNDVFMVTEPHEILTQLSSHLRKEGFRIVKIDDLPEARRLYERQRPDIIIVNFDCYPNHAMKFSRFIKHDSATLLYAVTTQNKPSLIMSLLDAGFNDVFCPPFNYDIMVARISKSIAILSDLLTGLDKKTGASGTFQELPFINLVQALSMSQKNVHITLSRGTQNGAEIYMREGQMVYSSCGEESGDEAIFRIISWRDEGSFSIDPASDFPADNISSPNDFILMEGCRQLDEGNL